ncbi:unnamed protein product, partial [Dicrocoelium dendriticum]
DNRTVANGVTSNETPVGPVSTVHQYGLKSLPTFPTLKIPLTTFVPVPSLPNLTDCGYSPAPLFTSKPPTVSSSLFTAAFTAAIHSAFPTDFTHFRAKSCQPLGRVSNFSSQENFSWPLILAEQNDEKPLDLTLTTRNDADVNPHKESTLLTSSKSTRNIELLVASPSTSVWRNPRSAPNNTSQTHTLVHELIHVHEPHIPLSSARHTIHHSTSIHPTGPSYRQRRNTVVKQSCKGLDQSTGPCETVLTRVTRLTNRLRRSVSTESTVERTTPVSDAEEYRSISPRTSPSSVPVNETRQRRSQSANESKPSDATDDGDLDDTACNTLSTVKQIATSQPHQQTRIPSTTFRNANCKLEYSVYNPRMRRFPEMTPKEIKDAAYWEKRVRNNEAARRSRRARKTKEATLREYAEKLEKVNAKLLEEISLLRQEVHRLKSDKNEKT